MRVRFWGTRGCIPTPGRHTIRFGGNTPCVELRTADGTIIILDCGTGAQALSLELHRSPRPLKLNLLIGHTHWDDIQGLPFFLQSLWPDTDVSMYAPAGFQRGLEAALASQMCRTNFSPTLCDLMGRIRYFELGEGFFRLGKAVIETQYLNHPASAFAFRISDGGATVAYVSNHEPFADPARSGLVHPGDQRHITFLKGVDLLIHDAQYSDVEYQGRIGWGHSPASYATEVALAAEVGRLALFHHDPLHDDDEVERLALAARALVTERQASLDVFAAAEGFDLEVQGGQVGHEVSTVSALQRRPIAGARVLMVSIDETEIGRMTQMLAEDGLVLLTAPDSHSALACAASLPPDLVIIDACAPDGDWDWLIQELRGRFNEPGLPALVLTEGSKQDRAMQLGAVFHPDYVAKPFNPSMLRARVRAQLSRSLAAFRKTLPGQALSAGEVPVAGHRFAGTYEEILAAVPLFHALSREQMGYLFAQATEEVYQSGTVLVRQGEPTDRIFLILSGNVRVVEASLDAPSAYRFVAELGQGELFGEVGAFLGEMRPTTVITMGKTRCLLFPPQPFLRTLQESPGLALAMLRAMASRLGSATRLLALTAPDSLTALMGRRAFREQYQRLVAGIRRRGSRVIVLVTDIVHLKNINDLFGYSIGDEVLRAVADVLVESTRGTDLVARYGGDEFAVLLVDAGVEQVAVIIDRVKNKLAQVESRISIPMKIECRIGVAVSHTPPETPDDLLREAALNRHQEKAEPFPAA
ncbi:MAG: diguanylate cyclase [Nitrospirae bacterium]|nr:diguanylate cyclase [Nitrospirota bacterium]